MIETRELLPRFGGVANLAPSGRSIGAKLLHAFVKLALVRVLVAARTRKILPVIGHNWLRRSFRIGLLFVTICTGNGNVAAGQHEVRLFVPNQRKRRGFIPLQRMAALAGVEVRSRRELGIVLVFVAIGATRKLNFEKRVFAFGDMTFGAFNGEMFPFERIGGSRVIFRREGRRFETLHCVASSAFGAGWALRELPIMWVGLMAIDALRESEGLLEISTSVAESAIHGRVLAF